MSRELYIPRWGHDEGDAPCQARMIEIRDRLLAACGCIVSVYTEEQYDQLDPTLAGIFAAARERHE
jgi:hypothetical protein